MSKNPLEELQEVKQKEAQTRKLNEIRMWETWKQAPEHEKPKHLEPLLKAYDPLLNRKVSEWSGGAKAIQPAAFKAELQKQFIGALHSFNPEKAALSTHVETRLKKAQRFVVKHQNLAYIPEGQVSHIGKIKRVTDKFQEEFGREPTHEEIADELGMPPKRIQTILNSMKRDVPDSSWDQKKKDSGGSHPAYISSRETEVLDMLQFALTPDEKQVFDLLYGRSGQPTIQSTNDIARKLNKTAPQISRLKTSILNKYNRYK